MPQLPAVEQLLEAGLHFGHKRSRRHPKMEPFLFTRKNEIAIIDVRKSLQCLEKALQYIHTLAQEGGTLLFVGTKRQAAARVKQYAEQCGQPYVTNRWIGGTLTNFAVIAKMIKKFHTEKQKMEAGEFQKYTKKEQLDRSREIEELDGLIGGIQQLTKLPNALFIIDINHDTTAVKEARKKNIPIVALCDANVNPELTLYPIPGNDDAIKSIELILKLISEAYSEGAARRSAAKAEEESKKAAESEIVTQSASL